MVDCEDEGVKIINFTEECLGSNVDDVKGDIDSSYVTATDSSGVISDNSGMDFTDENEVHNSSTFDSCINSNNTSTNSSESSLSERIEILQKENQTLKRKVNQLTNFVDHVRLLDFSDFQNDEKVLFYTGLSSSGVLMAVFNLIAQASQKEKIHHCQNFRNSLQL